MLTAISFTKTIEKIGSRRKREISGKRYDTNIAYREENLDDSTTYFVINSMSRPETTRSGYETTVVEATNCSASKSRQPQSRSSYDTWSSKVSSAGRKKR